MSKREKRMYYGAENYTFVNAAANRIKMTEAESLFWNAIKEGQLGFKFRRQHPVGEFIADFYCHHLQLVVELDGEYHEGQKEIEYDQYRTLELERNGIRVIRFKNEQILNNLKAILISLQHSLAQISSPFREGKKEI